MESRVATRFSCTLFIVTRKIGRFLHLSLWLAVGTYSQTKQVQTKQETKLTLHAAGPFDVKLAPQKPDNPQAEEAKLGRMSLDKEFHGDLKAFSKGEMISLMTEAKGSAVYVAIERVTGKLHGRTGSFALHHTGIMTRGEPELTIRVVPDSGSGELTGITGSMTIKIEGKNHFYEFDYSLPDAK